MLTDAECDAIAKQLRESGRLGFPLPAPSIGRLLLRAGYAAGQMSVSESYAQRQAHPQGQVSASVPREPTQAMLTAGDNVTFLDDCERVWTAMYDAAPAASPPAGAVAEPDALASNLRHQSLRLDVDASIRLDCLRAADRIEADAATIATLETRLREVAAERAQAEAARDQWRKCSMNDTDALSQATEIRDQAVALLREARDDTAELVERRRQELGNQLMRRQQPGIDLLQRIDAFLAAQPQICICGHDGKLTSEDCPVHRPSAKASDGEGT